MASDGHETGHEPGSRIGKLKPALLLIGIAVLLSFAGKFELGEKLAALQGWVGGLGSMGPAAFVAVYVCATVAMVPGSALTLFAGVLFGPVLGTICVSAGSTLGASLCFLIGRYLARGTVENWLSRSDAFRRLDELTQRRGAAIVAIARIVPVFPFNLLNYGFGLTRVKFGTYVFWSWLCMLPATVLYVVGGAAGFQAVSEREVPWALVGVIISLVILLSVVAKKASGKLQKAPPEIHEEGRQAQWKGGCNA